MPSLFNLQFKTEGVPSTEVVQISITVNDVKYVAVQDDKVKNKHKVRQVLWPRKTLALVRIQSLRHLKTLQFSDILRRLYKRNLLN
mmetsp:Transcript_22022/g.24611  ORF Transcript_22022/g.24611 Transcript_22022/m.24611 type:complete len:86 (-) Transcript_22022:634-891(-)